jgi:glycosyltransferase involved in cell wall biosynthesis
MLPGKHSSVAPVRISMVTATFNRAAMLERSLLSLYSQSYTNWQSVVIDGASSDNTEKVVRQVSRPQDVFVSEPDEGIYDALNKGIALADGEVIGILHSDDLLFDKDVLQKVAAIFSCTNAEIVYGDAIFFRNHLENIVRKYKSPELSCAQLARGRMPAHTAMFVKAHVYREVGSYKTEFDITGDYEWLCRACSTKALKYKKVEEPFVRMQTGGRSAAGLCNTIKLNREILKSCEINGINTNWAKVLSKYPAKLMEMINPKK